MKQLPVRLNQEPLVDVVFEVRFSSNFDASEVVPGYLFTKLEGEAKTERLPASDIPKQIRDQDQKLRFSPIVRLAWGRYFVSVGERVLTVSCRIPYPGWSEFRSTIHYVLDLVKDLGAIKEVYRYSLKYVDLLESSDLGEQISKINLSLNLGGHELDKDYFNLRMDVPEDNFLHLVSVYPQAQVSFEDGATKHGIIVDVDSLKECGAQPALEWFDSLAAELDLLHSANKRMFFKLVNDEALEDLEPIYA